MSAPQPAIDTYIGKYRVVQFIGAGGMAEVWLCRRSGIGGFEKPVVIKRILPAYAADEDFVRMFLDEARVAAQLNHPNVVQVYDIDTIDGVPFIAMEYVQGPSFQAMLGRARKTGQTGVGIATAVRVVSDIAAGLDYAHNATDTDGEPLGLVHRDISPHNILVSMDGTAKLLDFGVAKSRGRLSTTQVGTVKGKISHMAPEQATNQDLDHRADIYSLGVCLYEATTGRLPFVGDNEVQRLMQIVAGDFPRPSELVPGYPPELEQIVLAAMKRDREERTPTAHAMHEALELFASQAHLNTSHTSVKLKLTELFPRGEVAPAKGGLTPTPSSPRPSFTPGSAYRSPPRQLTDDEKAALAAAGIRTGNTPPPLPVAPPPPEGEEVELNTQTLNLGPPEVPARSRALPIAVGVAAALVLVIGAVLVATRRDERPMPTPSPAKVVTSAARDQEVRATLAAATKALQSRQFGAAAAVLREAHARPAADATLDAKVSALLDQAEAALTVEKARTLLGAKDFDGAVELANSALARDPANADAAQVIAEARDAKAATVAAAPATPKPAAAPAAKPRRPETPAAAAPTYDPDSLLPSDPDSLLPPTKN
jgi:serine/threonine protein kinase